MTRSQPPDPTENTAPGDKIRSHPLQERLEQVSMQPGVYLMKDVAGKVIYVGKARNLKKRVASYFRPLDQLDVKTGVLSQKIADFQTIITRSEKEALILESNLIKQYGPRYNVVLKDDKRYPSLRLDLKHPYPNLSIVRKTPEDGALYFGPFASAHAVRQSLKFINKTFKLRKCRNNEFNNRSRPCLHYQMNACLGPCCLDVDPREYGRWVQEVILFLNGRTPQLIRKVKKQMQAAAASNDFERAARLRDRMFALEKTLEKQLAVTTDFKDRDVLAIARSDERSLITVFSVRSGYLVAQRDADFTHTLSTDAELFRSFIRQYYEHASFVPAEILVPEMPEDPALLEEWLKECKGKKVRIHRPRRGQKAKILELAARNAGNRLAERAQQSEKGRVMLERIQRSLRLDRLPGRIECFDNSNLSGRSPVAGMVVFTDGVPDKSAYRTFAIKTVDHPDDYATMAEVLDRRYGKAGRVEPYPDLLIVDGGKGQLNVATAVMKRLGMADRFPVVGIAKKDENRGEAHDKIYTPGRMNPVNLERHPDVLLFLQRIRDEAHRFAIQFHRRRRSRSALRSELDGIPGIGPRRKTALLKQFRGIANIRRAGIDELAAVDGMDRRAAEALHSALKSSYPSKG